MPELHVRQRDHGIGRYQWQQQITFVQKMLRCNMLRSSSFALVLSSIVHVRTDRFCNPPDETILSVSGQKEDPNMGDLLKG
ncbi:hypothetical protein, partial [Rhizobium ruizarguesonis]|uniref:hypothetical protein n=1 Tax=Rhizobium ruizarguesonis TaxID=2081791 RepID=UPI0019538B60